MNEPAFVTANIKRWEQFEHDLRSKHRKNPDELARLFIQLTDDLAYARTHFPEGEVVPYLNNLTSQVHSRIYRNKREDTSRFGKFWKYEIPRIAYKHRRKMLYSLIIFLLSCLIGVISELNDPGFARLILGDSYMQMTEKNIEHNDPMGVYKKEDSGVMWVAIALNNVMVSLRMFAAGILLSFGSAWFLFYNGIMLGVFQTFFFQKGLLLASALSIWIHGTLEISSLIISGAAGLILGNSILFPGTFSRFASLQKGAVEGAKLVVGLVPIFIVAAFFESFVTRLTEAPTLVKLLIIVCSAVAILFYFVFYPRYLANHGKFEELQ